MMPKLIKAIDPADLIIQVTENLERGYEMHTPLFADQNGLLCQFLVRRPCLYEYALVIANDLDELETKVKQMVELDFDFIFHTVMWHGKYLQWMCRMNQRGLSVRDVVEKLGGEEAADLFVHADREEELKLVADVRAGLRLAPAAMGATVVTVPFPVNVS